MKRTIEDMRKIVMFKDNETDICLSGDYTRASREPNTVILTTNIDGTYIEMRKSIEEKDNARNQVV